MSTLRFHRLLYCSLARSKAVHAPAVSLSEILEGSRVRNEEAGVTGALLSCDGRFLQVLEGPMKSVIETYGRILRDQRHHDVRIIEAAEMDRRLFTGWGMCGVDLSPVDTEIVRIMESRSRFDPTTLSAAKALALLETVRNLQTKQRESDAVLL